MIFLALTNCKISIDFQATSRFCKSSCTKIYNSNLSSSRMNQTDRQTEGHTLTTAYRHDITAMRFANAELWKNMSDLFISDHDVNCCSKEFSKDQQLVRWKTHIV